MGHPPSALLRLVNPVLSFVLGTPLAGPLNTGFMVLKFTGRKSGRQFYLPVSAHVIDGDLHALTSAGWKANFRGGAPAEVVYNGKTTVMNGELIDDKAILPDLYLKCAQSYDLKRAQRMMGLKFRDNSLPTREEFAEAINRLKLIAVKLTPIG